MTTHISDRELLHFVRQSNRIEGIRREPWPKEIEAHKRFLAQPRITVEVMEAFVAAIAPGHTLRRNEGQNVRVGNHQKVKSLALSSPESAKSLNW
jgi:hypothetical protein